MATSRSSSLLSERLQETSNAPPHYPSTMTTTTTTTASTDKGNTVPMAQQQTANSISAAQAMESFKQLAASTDGGKSLLLPGLEESLAQGLALLARGSQAGGNLGDFPNAAMALEALRPFLEGGPGGVVAGGKSSPAPGPQQEAQAATQASVTKRNSRDNKTQQGCLKSSEGGGGGGGSAVTAAAAGASSGESESRAYSGRATGKTLSVGGTTAPTKTTTSSSSSSSQQGQWKPAAGSRTGIAAPRPDSTLVHAIRYINANKKIDLYQEEFGLDVVLLAEGGHVAAHCAVLAAASPFLKDLLLQDNDHPKIISITGTSLVALQGIIACLYQGEIPPGISLHALAEAARLLHMDGLLFVLQNAILAQGGTPLEPLCHPRAVTEMCKGGSEKSGKSKSTRLDQILYQKLNVDHLAPSDIPDPSSIDPHGGILGELLTKNDPYRSYLGYPSSDLGYDPLRTPLKPLNLSKPNKSHAQTTPTSSSSYFSTPVSGTPTIPNLDLSLSALSSYGPALSSAAATAAMSGLLTPLTPSNLSSIMSQMPPLATLSPQALDTLALQQHLLSQTPVPPPKNKPNYNKSSSSNHITNGSSNSLTNTNSQKTSSSRNNKSNSRRSSSSSSTTSSSHLSNQYANHPLMKNLAGITPEMAKEIYEQLRLNPQLASLAGFNNMNSLNPLSSSASLQSLANLHNLSNLQGYPPLFPYLVPPTPGTPPTVDTKLPSVIGGSTTSPSSIKKPQQQRVSVAMPMPGDQHGTLSNKTSMSSKATSNVTSAAGSLASMANLAGMAGAINKTSTANTDNLGMKPSNAGRINSPEVMTLDGAGVTNGSTISSQSYITSAQDANEQNKSDEKVKALLVDVSDVPTSILPPPPGSSREMLLHHSSGSTPGSEGSLVYVSPSMPTAAAMVASSLAMSIPGTMSVPPVNGFGLYTTSTIGSQVAPTMIYTDPTFADLSHSHHGLHGFVGDEHSGSVSSPEVVEIIEEIPGDPASAIRRTLYHPGHMGRKRKGCGECEGCQVVDDCSQCRFCRDKAKFGGPNRLKQVCVYKRCILAEAVETAAAAEENKKRRKMGLKKKNGKCGACEGCQRATDCGECYACLHNAAAQPPARRKTCEMRVCEAQQIEEFRVSLTMAAEPSPYSAESLLAESAGLTSPLSASSPTPEAQPSTHNDKMKLMRKMLKKKFAQPYSRVSPSKVRTKYYCGECPGCQTTTPCGHCLYCEDMPKFGGPGRYRQKCVKQLCVYHPRLQALKLSNRSKLTYDEQHINVDTLSQLGQSYQNFLAEHPEALAMWPEGIAMFAGFAPGVKMEEEDNTFSMEHPMDFKDGSMDEAERAALQKHYKDVQLQEMERKAKRAAEAAAIAKVAADATSIPAIISSAMPTSFIPTSAISASLPELHQLQQQHQLALSNASALSSAVSLANLSPFTNAVSLSSTPGLSTATVGRSNVSGLSSASVALSSASDLRGVSVSLSNTSSLNSATVNLSNATGLKSAPISPSNASGVHTTIGFDNTLVLSSNSSRSTAVEDVKQGSPLAIHNQMDQQMESETTTIENMLEKDINQDNNGHLGVEAEEIVVESDEIEEVSANSPADASSTEVPATTEPSSPVARAKSLRSNCS